MPLKLEHEMTKNPKNNYKDSLEKKTVWLKMQFLHHFGPIYLDPARLFQL